MVFAYCLKLLAIRELRMLVLCFALLFAVKYGIKLAAYVRRGLRQG